MSTLKLSLVFWFISGNGNGVVVGKFFFIKTSELLLFYVLFLSNFSITSLLAL